MQQNFDYGQFVARNSGYIADATQQSMRQTRLLIAGCGIGSSTAICATRMGFENFILVDGDVVDAHNLNRQFYNQADVGRAKVDALKDAILAINPRASVEAVHAYLSAENTPSIVGRSDIVFDTIDFLDLKAILGLHGSAKVLGRPVFTALSVGFGALTWFFPAGGAVSLIDLLEPDIAAARNAAAGCEPSYADVFSSFVNRLAPFLDDDVVEQVSKVLRLMKEGRPCPASQVAVGSFAIAAMATSMIQQLLAGEQVPAAPDMVLHSFKRQQTRIVTLPGMSSTTSATSDPMR